MTDPQEDDLPLEVVPRGPDSTLRSNRWFQFRKRYLLILLMKDHSLLFNKINAFYNRSFRNFN